MHDNYNLMRLECLIIRQPYASLVAFGRKRWEFRSYETRKTGLVGIAASPHEPLLTKNGELNLVRHAFPRGVVLATAELTSSFFVTSEDLKSNVTEPVKIKIHGYDLTTADEPIGEPLEDIRSAINQRNWESYAWLLENVKLLEKFIPLDKLEKSTWTTVEVPVDGKES